ncbi:hypothetical protein [Vibrio mexicanus]|uniref:hypothetical protein n=1 Tax=Vibrio mexicanus TaxID=1004326 RepID=UPI000A79016A|nr:hypothetical protein [Vibrio mexicanus]
MATRPVVYQDNQRVLPNKEAKVSVNPSQSFVTAGAVQVTHLGVTEYRVVEAQAGDELAMTLLRSVGWLSRRDFSTRGNGAGPDLPTPEAQCLGEHDYRLRVHLGRVESEVQCQRAEGLRYAPMLVKGHSNAWLEPVKLGNAALQVSALRKVGNELEMRIWNPSKRVQSIELSREYKVVNFIGEAQPMLTQVEPNQIVTLRLPA